MRGSVQPRAPCVDGLLRPKLHGLTYALCPQGSLARDGAVNVQGTLVKITDVTTTVLRQPDVLGIQDATIRHRDSGRSALFVHIRTDESYEGLGVGQPVARGVIEGSFKSLLIGQDPLWHEKLWDDMFWRVRGFGRKGVAFCAISAIDIALWDLKAKIFGVPLYRLLGPYTESVPIYGSGGWTSFTEEELVREQMGYVER